MKTNSARTLIWNFYPREWWENKFLLFKTPRLQYFVMATLELMKCYHKKSMFAIHFYSKVKSPGNQHRLKIHKNPHGSSFRRPEKQRVQGISKFTEQNITWPIQKLDQSGSTWGTGKDLYVFHCLLKRTLCYLRRFLILNVNYIY